MRRWIRKLFPMYTKEIIIAIMVISGLYAVQLFSSEKPEIVKGIQRPLHYEGEKALTLYYEALNKEVLDASVEIRIQPAIPELEEKWVYLKKINENFKQFFLSQYDNFQSISGPLIMPNNFSKVTIFYSSVESGYIDEKGWIDLSTLSSEKELKLEIHYSIEYQEIVLDDVIEFVIQEKSITKAYKELYIANEIEKEWRVIESNTVDNELPLPKGQEVIFYSKKKERSLLSFMMILMLIMTTFSLLSNYEEREKKIRLEKYKRIQLTYFINNFILMFQTGITIPKSFYMALDNRVKTLGEKHPVTPYFCTIIKKTDANVDFHLVIEEFIKAFDLLEGRRFGRLIMQTLKQGDHYLTIQLNQLSDTMWDERIRRARKESEKASSKLIFPMLIIFIVILIITIVPTFLEVNTMF